MLYSVVLPAMDLLFVCVCTYSASIRRTSASIRRTSARPHRLLSYWGALPGCLVSCCVLDINCNVDLITS